MQQILKKLTICLALTAAAAFAQTKPAFEVATIKPAPPMDQAKVLAAMQAGGKMPYGANIDSLRAEYLYMDLRSLMTYAYGVKPYQITGPDWMSTTRFDIVAKTDSPVPPGPNGARRLPACRRLRPGDRAGPGRSHPRTSGRLRPPARPCSAALQRKAGQARCRARR